MEPRRTISFTDLPVSQGARDLYAQIVDGMLDEGNKLKPPGYVLNILAAADEKDVRNLLWARRMGKL